MLAHSTMAETYLHTVLAEIVRMADTPAATVPSTVSGSTSALLQVAKGLEPPSAREGTAELYFPGIVDCWNTAIKKLFLLSAFCVPSCSVLFSPIAMLQCWMHCTAR